MSTPVIEIPAPNARLLSAETHGAHRLSSLQGRLADQLTMLIDDVARALALQDGDTDDAAADGANAAPSVPLHLLLAAGRRREAKAKERRQLAEDMVFSALRNLDNPDWRDDMDDFGEKRDGAFLLALLQWHASH